MPSRSDVYQDEDGNWWAFDPPYDEDEELGYYPGEDE